MDSAACSKPAGCSPPTTEPDPYLEIGFLQEISAAHDSAIQVRNQAIEWSFGIVGAFLLGSLVASQATSLGAGSLLVAWLGSGLALVTVLPLLQLAAWHHAYLRRLGVVREHVLRYRHPHPPPRGEVDPVHLRDVVWQVHILGKDVQSWPSIVWDTALIGLGFLVVAALAAFSSLSLVELQLVWRHGWTSTSTAVVLLLLLVLGVSGVEVGLLAIPVPNATANRWPFEQPAVYSPKGPCQVCDNQLRHASPAARKRFLARVAASELADNRPAPDRP